MAKRIGIAWLALALGACGPAPGPTATAPTTLKIYLLVSEPAEGPPLVTPPYGWSVVPMADVERLRVVQTVAVRNPVGRTLSLWLPGRGAMEVSVEEHAVRIVRATGDTIRVPTWDAMLVSGERGAFWMVVFHHNRPAS